jgi:hypothetical protein
MMKQKSTDGHVLSAPPKQGKEPSSDFRVAVRPGAKPPLAEVGMRDDQSYSIVTEHRGGPSRPLTLSCGGADAALSRPSPIRDKKALP